MVDFQIFIFYTSTSFAIDQGVNIFAVSRSVNICCPHKYLWMIFSKLSHDHLKRNKFWTFPHITEWCDLTAPLRPIGLFSLYIMIVVNYFRPENVLYSQFRWCSCRYKQQNVFFVIWGRWQSLASLENLRKCVIKFSDNAGVCRDNKTTLHC